MMYSRFKIIIFLLLLTFTTKAQKPESQIQKVNENFTNEKIHIHFDRKNYLAGETIWFKAYIMLGIKPSDLSTTFFCELIDAEGVIIDTKMYPIYHSIAIGDFTISDSLPTGAYTVRAYTRRMRNFENSNFYYQTLNIYNPYKKSEIINDTKIDYLINFLPESGNFIAEIENTLGFISTDNFGNSFEMEGSIFDIEKNKIVDFKTTHNGMGKISFIPQKNKTYTAICKVNNTTKTINIGQALNEGSVITVKKNDDELTIEVIATEITSTNLIPRYVLGVFENQVIFNLPIKENQKNYIFKLKKETLPSGIIQLTTFNANDKPLAERLLFVNTGDYQIKSNFEIIKKNLAAKGLNEYILELPEKVTGTFSASVIDFENDIETSLDQSNIYSRFLLQNDIKGKITNPNYYFEMDDKLHTQNADLLMLTHGWRKFSWTEILDNKFPKMEYKDLDYISTTVELRKDGGKDKLFKNKEIQLSLVTKTKSIDYATTISDDYGKISFSRLKLEDTARIKISNKENPSTFLLNTIITPKLENTFTEFNTIDYTPIFFPISDVITNNQKDKYNYLKLTNEKGVILEDVVLKTKVKNAKEKFEQQNVTRNLGSNVRKEIDFLNNPPTSLYGNIIDYLKGRIAGVYITGGPGSYQVNNRGTRSLIGGNIDMTIYLDEVQVTIDQASNILVDDVALVRVMGASQVVGIGGALAIYTKRGESTSFKTNGTLLNLVCYSPKKKYFSPNYDTDFEAKKIKKDERTTLHWNANLNSEKDENNIILKFNNNDKAKKLKVVVEGISQEGLLLHFEKIIE